MPDPTADLDQLLAATRAGSREALGDALVLCRQYLLAVANRQLNPALRSKGGASDIVQQTFLEAQRDFAKFQGDSVEELQAWLKHLSLNNAADFARGFQGTDKHASTAKSGSPAARPTRRAISPGTLRPRASMRWPRSRR